jgi:hypothetical protein
VDAVQSEGLTGFGYGGVPVWPAVAFGVALVAYLATHAVKAYRSQREE